MEKPPPISITRAPGLEIREVGVVREIRESIARVEGLPSVMNGQIVHFGHE